MGALVSIIGTIWPFFKEVVLGNKRISDFLLTHKWVVGNLLATFVLFLLFVNQYMVNLNIQIADIDGDKVSDSRIVELTTMNSRQTDKILNLEEKLKGLALEHSMLLTSCKPQVAAKPPRSVPRVHSPPAPADYIDLEIQKRLNKFK